MNRRTIGLCSAGTVLVIVFGLAFAFAPQSCDGGLESYFWLGVVALVVLLSLPFAVRVSNSVPRTSMWAFVFSLAGVGVWIGGLFAADFRIICRLF